MPQCPVGDELFLDHVGYFVADIEKAGQSLERLGFAVTPTLVQMNLEPDGEWRPSGTSNRLAALETGFIELLAPTSDTPLAHQLKQGLSRHEGIHLIALAHADLPGQRERLMASGFRMQDMVSLPSRRVPGQTAWSVLRPQSGEMPEGRVQFVTNHTPSHDYAVAPNGAAALTDLLLCVRDAAETATRYARYTGRECRQLDRITYLDLDRGRLLFMDLAEAQRTLPAFSPASIPIMAGQALLTIDLERTSAALVKTNIIPVFADPDLICIGPADALGAYLLFHTESVPDPWLTLASSLN